MLIDDSIHIRTAVCAQCGLRKPLSEFYCSRAGNRKVYACNICKTCKRERSREHYYHGLQVKRRYVRNDDGENQPETYDVRGRTVYARIIFYDSKYKRWRNEWLPIAEMRTEVDCYQLISVCRDFPTAHIKRMAARYLDSHGMTLEDIIGK